MATREEHDCEFYRSLLKSFNDCVVEVREKKKDTLTWEWLWIGPCQFLEVDFDEKNCFSIRIRGKVLSFAHVDSVCNEEAIVCDIEGNELKLTKI